MEFGNHWYQGDIRACQWLGPFRDSKALDSSHLMESFLSSILSVPRCIPRGWPDPTRHPTPAFCFSSPKALFWARRLLICFSEGRLKYQQNPLHVGSRQWPFLGSREYMGLKRRKLEQSAEQSPQPGNWWENSQWTDRGGSTQDRTVWHRAFVWWEEERQSRKQVLLGLPKRQLGKSHGPSRTQFPILQIEGIECFGLNAFSLTPLPPFRFGKINFSEASNST